MSCHATVSDGNGRDVVVKGMHCKFLVVETDGTTACSVYETRFEAAPWCHHSSEAKGLGMLRAGCPYNDKSGGKVLLRDDAYDTIWPSLLPQILRHVWSHWISPAPFLTELAKREPQTEWEWVESQGGGVFQPKGQPPSVIIRYPDVLRR